MKLHKCWIVTSALFHCGSSFPDRDSLSVAAGWTADGGANRPEDGPAQAPRLGSFNVIIRGGAFQSEDCSLLCNSNDLKAHFMLKGQQSVWKPLEPPHVPTPTPVLLLCTWVF